MFLSLPDTTPFCLLEPLHWLPISSSVQDGIYALGEAHMRSTPSPRSFSSVAFDRPDITVMVDWA